MRLNHLDAKMLLRVLSDARVEAVAVEYYADAQLRTLIQQIGEIVNQPGGEIPRG